jgi:Rieske Fe-S protein
MAGMSALGIGLLQSGANLAYAEPADERPQPGDALVSVDATTPLTPADIAVGARPLLAWPMDAASGTVRSGSRLNKLLVVRLDPASLDEITRARSADGIVAYSAICPHAGCDVSGWVDQVLECPCHASHYNPREAGAVIDGPTQRALPALPLKIEDGKLLVAKPFTSRPGIVQS